MRKSGAKIKHSIAAIPGIGKRNTYELPARAALVALQADCHTDDHLAHLHVLADLCDALNTAQNREQYITSHCESVRRRISDINESGRCGRLDYAALEPSVNILLEFFALQPNSLIARIARQAVERLHRREH